MGSDLRIANWELKIRSEKKSSKNYNKALVKRNIKLNIIIVINTAVVHHQCHHHFFISLLSSAVSVGGHQHQHFAKSFK